MAQEIELSSPQAISLQNAVQSKLVALGWSTDSLEDTSLAEYIVLSISIGKSREELIAELSADFLNVDVGDSSINDFSRWLYQEAEKILGVSLGYGAQDAQSQNAPQDSVQDGGDALASAASSHDTAMDETKDAPTDSIPTGPKSMRNMPQKPRDRRLIGQVNKAMDRSHDFGLHRIKGAAGGAGRINSHSHSREPPKGPRATMQRMAAMDQQQRMNNNNHGNMPMNPMNQGNMFGAMTPQQQMQLFAMYEEQARMMAQILSPQQQQQLFSNQASFNGNAQPQQQQQPQGKSLFDRIETGNNRVSTPQAQEETLSSMDVETTDQTADKSDPNATMCRFNLSCTKPDCQYAHQSPAAPPGVAVDMTDSCAFGAACQNRKCTGKHPSPAKLAPQRAEQDCKFFPHCTNPQCPFRHPTMPPCRNGADCNVPACKFSHSKVPCKYDPCLNPACPYKHAEGQKRGTYADRVWVPNEDGTGQASNSTEHISDRKFVDQTAGEEELILPKKGDDTSQAGITA